MARTASGVLICAAATLAEFLTRRIVPSGEIASQKTLHRCASIRIVIDGS